MSGRQDAAPTTITTFLSNKRVVEISNSAARELPTTITTFLSNKRGL